MKKKFIKIFILFIFLNLFLINKVFASTLILDTPKSSVGVGEQFYVDLMLDANGESINTVKGSLSFTDNISLLRVEDNKSIVSLWLEKPNLSNGIINFTGLIPNGFNGVIDPFNPDNKLPGLVTRLVFEAEKPGSVNFSTTPFNLNLNDGLGTEVIDPSVYLTLNVDNIDNKLEFNDMGNGLPELEAYVTRDPNMYNNKYVLIFKAFDKESGIKNVIIKEGWNNWVEVTSPYVLKDQSRHSDISLQAISNSGASIVVDINKAPYNWGYLIIISLLIVTIFFLICFRFYSRRKKSKNGIN